jgi:hypothetical protein
MSDDDYKTGPKRPPREHQFKKGQSGNPRGRPKGHLNVRTLLQEELSVEVGVKNGENIPVLRAILRRLVRKAAEGELRAIESVLQRAERYQSTEQMTPDDLPEEDAAILRRLGYIPPIDLPLDERRPDDEDDGDLVDG